MHSPKTSHNVSIGDIVTWNETTPAGDYNKTSGTVKRFDSHNNVYVMRKFDRMAYDLQLIRSTEIVDKFNEMCVVCDNEGPQNTDHEHVWEGQE